VKPSMYDSLNYWQHNLKKNEYIGENIFNKLRVQDDTIVLHMVLVNCYGESRDTWAAYPNSYAVLGYLRYVFLPSSFFTWLTRETEISIPNGTIEELMEIFEDSEKCNYKESIPSMYKQVSHLNELWKLDSDEIFIGLKEFAKQVHEQWNQSRDVFFISIYIVHLKK
jgi:hypothetical protein